MYPLASSFTVRRGAIAAVLLVCATPLAADEVYKSVDADGHVVYADRGKDKSAPKTEIRVEEPDPAEVARLKREQKQLAAVNRETTREQQKEARQRAQDAKTREAACTRARNHYYQVKDTRALYERDADGNRVYYTDEQADALRAQARQAMDTACGP